MDKKIMDAEPPKIADVRKMDSIQTSAGLIVENFGSINCTLPGNWKLLRKNNPNSYNYRKARYRIYKMEDSNLRARFQLCPKRFSKEELETFKNILNSEPHKLTKDELENLKPFLNTYSFSKGDKLINGKAMKSNGRVIWVNTYSKDRGEMIMSYLYSDSKIDMVPAEFAFHVQKADFQKYKSLIEKTVSSIFW